MNDSFSWVKWVQTFWTGSRFKIGRTVHSRTESFGEDSAQWSGYLLQLKQYAKTSSRLLALKKIFIKCIVHPNDSELQVTNDQKCIKTKIDSQNSTVAPCFFCTCSMFFQLISLYSSNEKVSNASGMCKYNIYLRHTLYVRPVLLWECV